MIEILLGFIILLNIALLVLVFFLLTRKQSLPDPSDAKYQFSSLEKGLERTERLLKQEMTESRDESFGYAQKQREELTKSIKIFEESLGSQMVKIAQLQKNQLDTFSNQLGNLTKTNESKLEAVRETVEKRLEGLQKDNSQKLEQMRATVDEKLHATLEKRLGESFKLVGDQLNQVNKGFGEMKVLTDGVGDLKKVLTNVKTRGTWGEMQLGNLLDQILTQDQYGKNIITKQGSNERVEYAIKLPGKSGLDDSAIWLPIDCKFPIEDYQRLMQAQDEADKDKVDKISLALERSIKLEAKKIKELYLDPPNTTDFAIMFLPIEGLYAEVLRINGLADFVQRDHRIIIAGPTTISALLNSLQIGFRTLTIEKKTSEIWTLLGQVKTEFGKFGDILDKTQKKLQEASNSIETASRSSRTIQRKLRDVQELPTGKITSVLPEASSEQEIP